MAATMQAGVWNKRVEFTDEALQTFPNGSAMETDKQRNAILLHLTLDKKVIQTLNSAVRKVDLSSTSKHRKA